MMGNTVLYIVDANKCAGCAACYNTCPNNAIEMQLSAFGFYIPEINEDKCVDCAKCLQYCPVNVETNLKQFSELEKKPITYGAWSYNDNIRINSSSGGIFTELAIEVLKEGGIVFGAGWNNHVLQHIEIREVNDVYKLQGSKYIPSYIGKSYKNVCSYLRQGKKVMFSGTPCQIAALKGMIQHKNLITIDLICHGVPSTLAFQKYLISKIGTKKLKTISFRDKEYGWENYSIKITTVDGDSYTSIYKFDPFMVGFLDNYYLNYICYDCPFSKIPRKGDITLGDFWGVDEKYKSQKGISAILVNSDCGEALINRIKVEKRIYLFETDVNAISKNNKRLIEGSYKIPAVRERLLRELLNEDFGVIQQKFIKVPDQFLLEKLKPRLANEQLVIFGTSSACRRLINLFNEKNVSYNIKFFIDNDRGKWGKKIFSKEVYKPDKLLQENKGPFFIIVASSYYNEIKSQLEAMGLAEDVDFFNGMVLLL